MPVIHVPPQQLLLETPIDNTLLYLLKDQTCISLKHANILDDSFYKKQQILYFYNIYYYANLQLMLNDLDGILYNISIIIFMIYFLLVVNNY